KENFETSPKELQEMMLVFNEMADAIQTKKNKLEEISTTDGLTGVANRRLFEIRLDKEWKDALKCADDLSLIFIDIDFFKQYNARFGHQQGDLCLIQIATAIDYLMQRTNYLVARYGGEEFVVILPETSTSTASVIAEIIRNKVRDLQIPRKTDQVAKYVTASIGVATMNPA